MAKVIDRFMVRNSLLLIDYNQTEMRLQMSVLHSSVEIVWVLRWILEKWMRTDRPSSYENRQDNNYGIFAICRCECVTRTWFFPHIAYLRYPLNSQYKLRLLTYTALNFTPYNSKAVCFLWGMTEFLSIRYLEQCVLDMTIIDQYSS